MMAVAGSFACVILAPGVPEIARNKVLMHDLNLLLPYIPMDVRTILPMAIAIIFVSTEITDGVDLLMPMTTDPVLKPVRPFLLMLIGAFIFLATALVFLAFSAR